MFTVERAKAPIKKIVKTISVISARERVELRERLILALAPYVPQYGCAGVVGMAKECETYICGD